jgi:hypothetical protein
LESRGSGGGSASCEKRKTDSGNEKRASSHVDSKRSKTTKASSAVIMGLLVSLCATTRILGGPDAPDIMSPDQNIGWHEYMYDTSCSTAQDRWATLHTGVGIGAVRVAFPRLPQPLDAEDLEQWQHQKRRWTVVDPTRASKMAERCRRAEDRDVQKRVRESEIA